jgi:hypothetical protein
MYKKNIIVRIKHSRLVLSFENRTGNRMLKEHSTIQKPDRDVRFLNGIQFSVHSTLGHKLTIQIQD